MSDNPLKLIPVHDRVSIPAVLVPAGAVARSAITAAHIVDPAAIPVVISEARPGRGLGDGITPNLTGVLELVKEGHRNSHQGCPTIRNALSRSTLHDATGLETTAEGRDITRRHSLMDSSRRIG